MVKSTVLVSLKVGHQKLKIIMKYFRLVKFKMMAKLMNWIN